MVCCVGLVCCWLVVWKEVNCWLDGWMGGWIQIPEHIKYVMSTWALFAWMAWHISLRRVAPVGGGQEREARGCWEDGMGGTLNHSSVLFGAGLVSGIWNLAVWRLLRWPSWILNRMS